MKVIGALSNFQVATRYRFEHFAAKAVLTQFFGVLFRHQPVKYAEKIYNKMVVYCTFVVHTEAVIDTSTKND